MPQSNHDLSQSSSRFSSSFFRLFSRPNTDDSITDSRESLVWKSMVSKYLIKDIGTNLRIDH